MSNPSSSLFHRPLIAENFFHVYNKSNGREPLFSTVKDHHNFLECLKRFVHPFVDIYAYNMIFNHFHLLIETLNKEKILNRLSPLILDKLPYKCRELLDLEEENMSLILKNRFSAAFSSYAQTYNHFSNRTGNLFHRRFCRKLIHTDGYLKKCLYYINNNAVNHGIFNHIENQPWSSYNSFLDQDYSLLNHKKIINLFGSTDAVVDYHMQKHNLQDSDKFSIEEADIEKEENKIRKTNALIFGKLECSA